MRLEGLGLGYRYRNGPWLFRDVHLSLASGEIVGLFGPSGSGKTTLGRILAGYEHPLIGSVRVDGMLYPIRGYHPVQMVFQHPERAVNPRWRIGRILQESMLLEDSLEHHNWTATRVLDLLGIMREWLDRRPAELSGGELQRVCIARALAPSTRFLIADEMTTMLDAISQAQVWQVVLDVARARQIGVLVISHDRHLLNRVCDRVIEWPVGVGGLPVHETS